MKRPVITPKVPRILWIVSMKSQVTLVTAIVLWIQTVMVYAMNLKSQAVPQTMHAITMHRPRTMTELAISAAVLSLVFL